jgi:hypothetical protein
MRRQGVREAKPYGAIRSTPAACRQDEVTLAGLTIFARSNRLERAEYRPYGVAIACIRRFAQRTMLPDRRTK